MFSLAGFSALYDMDIQLRDSLLRVLLRLNVSNVSGGGSKVVWDSSIDFLSLEFSAQDDEVLFPPYLLGSLRSCRSVDLTSTFVWRVSLGS